MEGYVLTQYLDDITLYDLEAAEEMCIRDSVSIFERDVGSGRIAAVQSHHFCVIQRSICDAAVSLSLIHI